MIAPDIPAADNPARQLVGRTLDGGWRVIELIERVPGSTGGFFSQRYRVEGPEGQKAFLKALDFTEALRNSNDPARVLQALTEAFNYERDLLIACNDRRLTHIVMVIADGMLRVSDAIGGAVQYLIFEEADGDARTQMDQGDVFDQTLRLRALQHVSIGLRQLHGIEVAHQDLKPSNVLMFGHESKIGDLGCASKRGTVNPREHLPIIGDPSYAPPELLYRFVPEDWAVRRFACDLYLLGSMVSYFFVGSGMTRLWFPELHVGHSPAHWRGQFEELLPYLRSAFDRAFQTVVSSIKNQQLAKEIDQIVRQLCDPDPRRRGHPRNRMGVPGSEYSLERYVTQFDRLARRSLLGEFSA